MSVELVVAGECGAPEWRQFEFIGRSAMPNAAVVR
jgi:hypothetical protein